jgi:hypothetical protein
MTGPAVSPTDQCRRDVAARGLTPDAVTHLTRYALGRLELDNLAPVKRSTPTGP